jgi:hypothetical protein
LKHKNYILIFKTRLQSFKNLKNIFPFLVGYYQRGIITKPLKIIEAIKIYLNIKIDIFDLLIIKEIFILTINIISLNKLEFDIS